MSRDNSDHVNAHFSGTSEDLTAAFACADARVLYVPNTLDPAITQSCASILSHSELQRAHRFAGEFDTARFIQRRAFARFCGGIALGTSLPLSRIVFNRMKTGRPCFSGLPQYCFSFSSCNGGFLGAWSPNRAIGVDLEDPSRPLEAAEMARRFFSEAEARAVEVEAGADRLTTFFRFWTLKEAALKSIGMGLPFGLDAFQFEFKPCLRVVRAPDGAGGPGRFDARLAEISGGCAALVLHRPAR